MDLIDYTNGQDPCPGYFQCARCNQLINLDNCSDEAILTGVCDDCRSQFLEQGGDSIKTIKINKTKSRVVRIDNEVYTWLQKQAKPFEDTPNTVLRRIAGLKPKLRRKEVIK